MSAGAAQKKTEGSIVTRASIKRSANNDDENAPIRKRGSFHSSSGGMKGVKLLMSPTTNSIRLPFSNKRAAPNLKLKSNQPQAKRRRTITNTTDKGNPPCQEYDRVSAESDEDSDGGIGLGEDALDSSSNRDNDNGNKNKRPVSVEDPYSDCNAVDAFPPSFFLFRRRSQAKLKDSFDILPNEMILKIFKWLPKSSLASANQVCKRFNRLGSDELLWRRVDGHGKNLYPGQLASLLSKNPIILRLSQANLMTPSTEISALANPLQLSMLDLSLASINVNTLSSLISLCPTLNKLSLEHLTLNDQVIESLLIPAKSLDTLNLTMCSAEQVSPGSLIQFFNKATGLKVLNMSWMPNKWTSKELLDIVGSLPPSLEQLNIAGYRNIMRDTHIDIIAERCTKLVDLDVSDSQFITMVGLEAIVNLDRVQHLAISRCYSIEAVGYPLLGQMKSLQFLEVYSLFKESSLKQIFAHLTSCQINQCPFSSIARPTYGNRRNTIWAQRVK